MASAGVMAQGQGGGNGQGGGGSRPSTSVQAPPSATATATPPPAANTATTSRAPAAPSAAPTGTPQQPPAQPPATGGAAPPSGGGGGSNSFEFVPLPKYYRALNSFTGDPNITKLEVPPNSPYYGSVGGGGGSDWRRIATIAGGVIGGIIILGICSLVYTKAKKSMEQKGTNLADLSTKDEHKEEDSMASKPSAGNLPERVNSNSSANAPSVPTKATTPGQPMYAASGYGQQQQQPQAVFTQGAYYPQTPVQPGAYYGQPQQQQAYYGSPQQAYAQPQFYQQQGGAYIRPGHASPQQQMGYGSPQSQAYVPQGYRS
ncbi:hypothetical protein HDV05_001314 [Chytridiales sp. JEL 0842]|nr:hypothetical protein HDV05_001314 [Chytridiales sp. JEL 0842]